MISDADYQTALDRLGLELIGTRIASTKHVLHRCKSCQTEAMKLPHSVIAGRGCKICQDRRARKTKSTYQEDLRGRNITIIGEYISAITKTLHKCEICKNEWLVKPNKILSGRGCTVCARNKVFQTKDEYVINLKLKNICIYPIEKFVSMQTAIDHQCQECSHIWKIRPDRVQNSNCGCPNCAIEKSRKTQKQYRYDLSIKNSGMIVCDDVYQGSNVKIAHRHLLCGNRWLVRPMNLLAGSQCPQCSRLNYRKGKSPFSDPVEAYGRKFASKLEFQCFEALLTRMPFGEFEFERKYLSTRKLMCDFYIPAYELWIEVSNFNDEPYLEKIYNKRKLVKNFLFAHNPTALLEVFDEFVRNREIKSIH